jgi:hypothetical protein
LLIAIGATTRLVSAKDRWHGQLIMDAAGLAAAISRYVNLAPLKHPRRRSANTP